MTEKINTLTVSNMAQKVIFSCEMQGQISDGMWENASPDGHWIKWTELDPQDVLIDHNNIGRNFYAVKDNYNFANKELLDIVADRIILKINLLEVLGEPMRDILENNHWAIPDNESDYARVLFNAAAGDEYYEQKKEALDAIGLTPKIFADAVRNGTYTRRDLNRDCRALRVAVRTYRE